MSQGFNPDTVHEGPPSLVRALDHLAAMQYIDKPHVRAMYDAFTTHLQEVAAELIDSCTDCDLQNRAAAILEAQQWAESRCLLWDLL